jgi:hypothetical protein
VSDARRNESGTARAAALVRATPLLGRGEGTRTVDEVLECGWFCGIEECGRVLGEVAGAPPREGRAFGRAWPWLEVEGAIVGPGLPVAVPPAEVRGPDAGYRREGRVVLREAGGRQGVFLALDADPGPGDDDGPDLLWFGDAARHVVRGGRLEIEDLFSSLSTPVSRALLDRLLVRGRRCDAVILDRLSLGSAAAPPPILTVARPAAITPKSWADPEVFFRVGVGLTDLRERNQRLCARGPDGGCTEIRLGRADHGWEAAVESQALPFVRLTARREGPDVVLSATIADRIDPHAAGMRERLAFDLTATLVALG